MLVKILTLGSVLAVAFAAPVSDWSQKTFDNMVYNGHMSSKQADTTHSAELLGKEIDVLSGLKGDLHGEDRFFAASTGDIITADNIVTTENAYKSFGPFVQLTFHPDITDLLQEFYGTIQFEDGLKAGGLFLVQDLPTNSPAVSSIASELGIEPEHIEDEGNAFVLARYWKKVRTHSATGLVNANNLKNINRSEPDDIISLYSTDGTHYVSEYEEGDFIYQIFVYERSVFDEVNKNFPDDPTHRFGWKGSYFRRYTEERHVLLTGVIAGFTSFVGAILAASRDSNFDPVRPSLYDDVFNVPSLVMILTDYSIALQTNSMTSLETSKIILKPIAEKVFSSDENAIQEDWNEVLKGALFQKYGSQCSPGFKQISASTPLAFYSTFNPDLVTSTASPYTSIVQAHFNLADIDILNPEYVTDLFIFADVIELSEGSTVHLPGSGNIYLICREFRSNSVGSSVPEIVVGSVETETNIKVIASSFHGVMKLTLVSTITNSYSYVGESVFKTETGNAATEVVSEPTMELRYPTPSIVPKLYSTGNTEYRDTWLARSFLNGMELLAVTIENVHALNVGDSIQTAKKSLDWVIDTLVSAKSEATVSNQLETVLSRALLLKKLYPNSGQPLLIVPILTFPQYKPLYDSLLSEVQLYENKLTAISEEISRRKLGETVIHNQQELNRNILENGEFMVGVAKSDAQYYEDVTNMYDQLTSMKEVELNYELDNMKKLSAEVTQYSESVRVAGDSFAKKVEEYQAKATFDLVAEMVSTIGGLFAGGYAKPNLPEELGKVANVAKKVKAITFLSDVLEDMYDSIDNIADKVNHANAEMLILPDMSRYDSQFPTVLDWEDFQEDVNVYTDAATLGCCGYVALAFRSAVSKMTTRGKIFLALQRKVSQLQYEIMVNKLNADVADKQKERLNELSNTLDSHTVDDFQADTVDLFEVGNILQSRANTVRMQLARTYLTMDAALQYYYLKPATPLSGYDTLAIQSAASRQIADSITAFEHFPSQPHDLQDPVVYEIPMVRVSDLTSESGYRHTIPLTAAGFNDFVRVRIREIRVTINSISSAGADGIFVKSEYIGDKCRDRGLHREERIFSTAGKNYLYVYNYKDGSMMIGNEISEDLRDKNTMMTPFGEWTFTIPTVNSTNLNVDVAYSGELTTLRIEFYLNIILQPESGALARTAQVCTGTGLSCLKEKIGRRTITGKFDAVMALDAERINELWKHKYEYQSDHGGFANDFQTEWGVVLDLGVFKYLGRLSGTVGPPTSSFIPNNPSSIELVMNTTNAVYNLKQVDANGNHMADFPDTTYTTPIQISTVNDITKMRGHVDSQKMVVVDMTSSLVSISIAGLTDTQKNAVEAGLKTFFKQINSSSYDLGTVDYNSAQTPASLQPREFFFSTAGSESSPSGYGTLLLCILTGSSAQALVEDPLTCEISVLLKETDSVIPSGNTAALYVSSKIIFDIILTATAGGLGISTNLADISDELYPSKKVTADANSKVTYSVTYTIAPTCTGPKYPTSSVSIPAANLELNPTGSGALEFTWPASWAVSITNYKDNFGHLTCSASKDITSADFTMDSTGLSTPSVDSNGVITFPQFNFITSVGASVGWNFFADNYGRQAASDAVAAGVKSRVNGIRFNFKPISIFALTNLIFPEAKVVDPTAVYLFGDLLVLGDVVREYNPNPTL